MNSVRLVTQSTYGIDGMSSPFLDRLPQEIIVDCMVRYINQRALVCLTATSRYLMRFTIINAVWQRRCEFQRGRRPDEYRSLIQDPALKLDLYSQSNLWKVLSCRRAFAATVDPWIAKRLSTRRDTYVATSPNGNIITGSVDGVVRIWTTAGKRLASLKGHHAKVEWVAISPNNHIVSCCSQRNICVWTETGELVGTFKANDNLRHGAVVSPCGNVLLREDNMRIWSSKGTLIATLTHSQVKCSILLPDGNFATASASSLGVWSTTGECLATHEGYPSPIECMLGLPDGRIVTGHQDGRVVFTSVKGKLTVGPDSSHGSVRELMILPSGEIVASHMVGAVCMLAATTGVVITTLQQRSDQTFCPLIKVALNGDIVVRSAYAVRIWSVNGKLITVLPEQSRVDYLSSLPNGDVVLQCNDNMVRIWSRSIQPLFAPSRNETALRQIVGMPTPQPRTQRPNDAMLSSVATVIAKRRRKE